MSYRIKRRETPSEAVARIASEETGAALADLADPNARGVAEAVHDCRKRCRKMRGLLRLAPPAKRKRTRQLDRTYRDAARALAGYRDAHATLATLDRLIAVSLDLPEGLGPVRRELLMRSETASDAVERGAEPIERARDLLTGASALVDGWTADGDGWRALGPGLGATYAAGVTALDDLIAAPGPGPGHELRKQAKYTWYHLRLVQRSAPSILVPLTTGFEDLVECLGDANDLAVLASLIDEEPEAFGETDGVDATRRFLDDHRGALLEAAIGRARRLYVEEPAAFVRRLGRYWKVWHRHGPERPVGPIGRGPDGQDLAPDDGLDELTVAQLRPLARELGLHQLSSRRRHELLADLRAHGIGDPPA